MRQKAFHVCPFCELSIHFKSWKTHLREHGQGEEQGLPPTKVRITQLEQTIARLRGEPQHDTGLLAEYESGMLALREQLAWEEYHEANERIQHGEGDY